MIDFDMSSLECVAEKLGFPEGPVALGDGSAMVTEIRTHSVARIAPDGSITRFDCAKGPNGMAIGPDGMAYVMSDGGLEFIDEEDGLMNAAALPQPFVGGVIQRMDPESGAIETIYEEVDGHHLGVLNDCVFDAAGMGLVVDTVFGKIYYFDPKGGMIRTAATGLATPNGLGLSPDGKTAYVAETQTGNIWRLAVTGAGEFGEKELLYSIAGQGGFDGLAIDGNGNVCVAQLGASGILVVSPEGEKVGFVPVPDNDLFVTRICFGGEDMRDAWICSAGRGRLYKMRWPHPGLRLNYNA